MKKQEKFFNKRNGITLIALVVTIVVLIILATVSISAVFDENGILKSAQNQKNMSSNYIASEEEKMDELLDEFANAMAGSPVGPNGNPLTSTVTSTNHRGTQTEDRLGNPVYIPGGFKIASGSGSTVKEGIVVEDASGNQFVWIPVSNIDGSQSNPIKIDATNSVVITLGRYTFSTSSPGNPTIVQKGSDWDKTTNAINETYKIVNSSSSSTYHYELATKIEGKNEVAKSLSNFISSVNINKGYYIARYEASYSSGSSIADYKPASKVSTNKKIDSWTPSSSTVGCLWNLIFQSEASKVCQNMYNGNSYVESDLVNSYAWDTAIVYIQAMGNSNYANQGSGSNVLLNTGETGDEKCKIFDMAGNVKEWITEYSTSSDSPCTLRGGSFGPGSYTSYRNSSTSSTNGNGMGFRALLYCKTGA